VQPFNQTKRQLALERSSSVHHSASYVEGVQYAVGSFQEETKSDAGLRLLPFEGLEMSSGGGGIISCLMFRSMYFQPGVLHVLSMEWNAPRADHFVEEGGN
jgi:hypothetical protein